MSSNDDAQEIEKFVRELSLERGVDLIEFKVIRSRSNTIIRCILDYPHGGITINVCAEINKLIVAFIEEKELLTDAVSVEVYSPGLDRKLFTYKDFLRIKGRSVSLWLTEPVNEKSCIEGALCEVSEQALVIIQKGGKVIIPLNLIQVGKEKIMF